MGRSIAMPDTGWNPTIVLMAPCRSDVHSEHGSDLHTARGISQRQRGVNMPACFLGINKASTDLSDTLSSSIPGKLMNVQLTLLHR